MDKKSHKSVGFDRALTDDEVMKEIKVRLEEAKVAVVQVHVEAVQRMRELMAIDSDGQIGENGDDTRAMDEIPLMLMALSESMSKELCVMAMDKLIPDWQRHAAKHMLDSLLSNLTSGSETDSTEEETRH